MEFVNLYKCLCDVQRLRMLNLLREGPLCVCHLMEILDADQVKMSKQLRYMKSLGMVEGVRRAQWMVYRLASPASALLEQNLACLQDLYADQVTFSRDLRRRQEVLSRAGASLSYCELDADFVEAPSESETRSGSLPQRLL